jgi:hypothetical protein
MQLDSFDIYEYLDGSWETVFGDEVKICDLGGAVHVVLP